MYVLKCTLGCSKDTEHNFRKRRVTSACGAYAKPLLHLCLAGTFLAATRGIRRGTYLQKQAAVFQTSYAFTPSEPNLRTPRDVDITHRHIAINVLMKFSRCPRIYVFLLPLVSAVRAFSFTCSQYFLSPVLLPLRKYSGI